MEVHLHGTVIKLSGIWLKLNGTIRTKVFIDVSLVWNNHRTGLYDHTPKDRRIWLGSGVDKHNSDVPDVVYRNFKLFSYAPQDFDQ
ncbi:MAG: hypothetical protein MZV64_25230 [Ignavibacteriales bacterium]|nr:hypothetical protein [Ignavibacteriales bacterium]